MPVFPGETSPSLLRDNLPDDIGYVTHRLESNMHTGTHIDAPFHAKADEITIDMYPIETFSGSTAVIDVRGISYIQMQPSWELIFSQNRVILFCTGFNNSWQSEKYYYEYPEFDSDIARSLVKCGVQIAGFDSPSPDKAPYDFHSIFLRSGRFLVENLTNLEKLIGINKITFMAFPLKIEAEASLIRAVASIEE